MKRARAYHFILVVLIACAALFSGYYLNYIQSLTTTHTEIAFDKKWDMTINNEYYGAIDLGNEKFPLANKGDLLTFESAIPAEIPAHPVFVFRTIHSDIEVLIDGISRYSYGQDQYDSGKMVGYGHHYVSLSDEDAGKDIKVIIRVSENSAFTSLDEPLIVNADYYQRDFMIQSRIRLLIMQFLILFGISFSIIALFTWKRNVDSKRLFALSLFSISIGIWSICTTDLIRFYTYNLHIKNVLEFSSLYLAPACVLGYFGQEIKKEGKLRWTLYLIGENALNVFFVLTVFLQATNLVHLPVLLKVEHILILICIIGLIVRFVVDLVKGNEHNLFLVYGFTILTVFVMGDMVRYNLKKFTSLSMTDHYDSTIYLGMFVFVIALIADYSRRTFRHFYKRIQQDMLEKMAYTDELTGLYNRHHMESVMDEIDTKKEKYAVIGFDLNNLKIVNDSMGHEVGDEYIKTFGRVIQETFGKYATVIRIGGDEFEVIIEDIEKMSLTLGKLLGNMKEKLDAVNTEHSDWNMTVAYGIADYNEPECHSIRQAMKIADDRMYKMKKEMKSDC